MNFEFTKSIISIFTNLNNLNFLIVGLSLINFTILSYQLIKKKGNIKDIFKIENVKQILNVLALLTVSIIILIFPEVFKHAILIIIFYYLYCIYIVPIFDIKDSIHKPDIPEVFLIIMSGFYYYFSIVFSSIVNLEITTIDNNSAVQIIYVITLLMLLFTFTYCLFLNIYYILKVAVTHLMDKITSIKFKNEEDIVSNLKIETNTWLRIVKLILYYLLYVVSYFIYLFIFIIFFPCFILRNIKDIPINKILSIIAKLSIIFSLISVFIIMKIDNNYSELFISIYEALISIIIIPLVLEGLLSVKRNSN